MSCVTKEATLSVIFDTSDLPVNLNESGPSSLTSLLLFSATGCMFSDSMLVFLFFFSPHSLYLLKSRQAGSF